MRTRAQVLLGLAALAAAGLALISPWGLAADRFVYDNLLILRGPRPAPPEIVIVAIDEPSFGVLGRQWPWPRSLHGRLLDALFAAGAATVAFDVVFAEPSRPEEDQALAQAVARAPSLVLAVEANLIRDQAYVQESLVGPLPELRGPTTGLGLVNLPVDPDGFVRDLPAPRPDLPGLALAAALAWSERTGRPLAGRPPAPDRVQGINFLGPARSVKTVSYYQALLPGHLPAGFFRDKLVLVGLATASEVEAKTRPADAYPTPFARWRGGYMPGVEIHAQAAASLLHGTAVDQPPLTWSLALGLGLGLGAALAFFRLKPAGGGGLAAAVSLAGLGATHLLLARRQVYLSPLALLLPSLTAYLVSPFVHYWRTWQEKTFIRRAFAMYLAPQVVNRLLEQPDRLNLGGEAVEATVLFSDLAGFTSFSEKLTPHEVIDLLNRYLGRFSEIVFAHQGMIDKFIGDAVMAVWGVPLAQADHAGQACRTALAMARAVEELKRQEAGLTGLKVEVRVGLNSGPMVAGNVGASRFFNYTVLGHEVNLASRLEGLNRIYGTRIILGQGTAALVAEAFELRELDRVRVKGQAIPVTVHELQAPKGGLGPVQAEVNRLFALGRQAYLAHRFAEAAGLFDQALGLKPEDGPSRTLAARCRAHLVDPPEPNWDCIYDALEK